MLATELRGRHYAGSVINRPEKCAGERGRERERERERESESERKRERERERERAACSRKRAFRMRIRENSRSIESRAQNNGESAVLAVVSDSIGNDRGCYSRGAIS